MSAASGIPVEINNTNLNPSPYANAVTAGAAANITQLPDLYPFNNGYGLFAGDCPAELGAGELQPQPGRHRPGWDVGRHGAPRGDIGAGRPLGGCVHRAALCRCLLQPGVHRRRVMWRRRLHPAEGRTRRPEPDRGPLRHLHPDGHRHRLGQRTGHVGGSSVVANGFTIQFPSPIPVAVAMRPLSATSAGCDLRPATGRTVAGPIGRGVAPPSVGRPGGGGSGTTGVSPWSSCWWPSPPS